MKAYPAIVIPRKRVLWSGGFDSTYLVVSSLLAGEHVEATYLTYTLDWQKQRRETEAINRIASLLPGDLRKRLVMPKLEDLGDEAWNRWRTLYNEMAERSTTGLISPQLPMIAAVAEQCGPLNAAFVKGDETAEDPLALDVLREHNVLTPLLNLSKVDLYNDAKQRGFANLLDLTWSCEGTNDVAVHGPCGECEPCKHRIAPVNALYGAL